MMLDYVFPKGIVRLVIVNLFTMNRCDVEVLVVRVRGIRLIRNQTEVTRGQEAYGLKRREQQA